MPVFRPGTRNQGSSGTKQAGMSAQEAAERRKAQQERRAENQAANRITASTQPISGRVTYPNGSFVSTGADGVLGGQFGANPAYPPGAYDVPLPPGYGQTPTPQVAPVNSGVVAIGGYKYSTKPGTGGMPGTQNVPYNTQNPSLIGTGNGGSGGGNYYATSENYTTLQTAEQAQSKYQTDTTGGAYALKADYGVRGDKWKTKVVQTGDGTWVKVTVPDYSRGWKKQRNRYAAGRTLKQQLQSTQSYQQYEQSLFSQTMNWRMATG